MTNEKKAPTGAGVRPAPQVRDTSTARVDAAAFRDALAKRIERKRHESRALAQQLAESAAGRTSPASGRDAIAKKRARTRPRDVSG